MPPPDEWTAIRSALLQAKERDGLRPTARAVSLSVTGLSGFLEGREPYAPTRKKLLAWAERQAAEPPERPDRSTLEAAANMLVSGLPSENREAVRAELLRIVEEAMSRPEA